MDIPETVANASGVAAEIADLLNSVKYTQMKEKTVDVPEKEVKITDEPRIGVMVCHCGINIGNYVDVPRVVEYVSKLPNVVVCEANLYSCSSDSQIRIKQLIAEHNLNRFIVASCTPRTHESLFQETCQEAGMNKYLFELVNIRDQCSWVHMTEKEAATEKAMDLIRMNIAKSKLLKPQKEDKIDITHSALVIGGGVSGMTAALNTANQGFSTILVEKESELGGNLKFLNVLYPVHKNALELLNELKEKIEKNSNIQVFLNAGIKNVKGYVGNYDVAINDSDNKIHDVKIGTIIVATGGQEYKPVNLFEYSDKNDNVMTQLELEQKLKNKDHSWLDKIKRVTFILCVNARQNEGITYCSNICCAISMKNVRILKELKPELEIVVIYRDLQMAKKEFEEYYRERRKDAIFLRYDLDNLPEVIKSNNSPENYQIKVFDTNLKDYINYETDLLILATPMIPADNLKELAMMLKVPLDKNGFFLEAHVKLRPLDFATDGIFLCGCAQWPKNIQDSAAQANGAAGRASRFLSADKITTSGLVAEVLEEKCIGCGKCEDVCPYKAITFLEVSKEFEDVSIKVKKSNINAAVCKGCGTCAATCPVGAIMVKHYDFDQISTMIDSYLLEKEEVENGF
jgi:heterodisulfide reductase subunit A